MLNNTYHNITKHVDDGFFPKKEVGNKKNDKLWMLIIDI